MPAFVCDDLKVRSAGCNLRFFQKLKCTIIGIILVAVFTSVGLAASTNTHVILLTIDGVGAYYLSDPRAPIPTLRRLASEGAVAEGLRVSDPAVTWPNHTTLVTGVHPAKHSVLFNGILVRTGAGQPVKIDGSHDQKELVKVPTIFDRLYAAGYRSAAINWPCTRGAKSLADNFPDVPEQITHMTPRLRLELIAKGILDDEEDQSFTEKSAASRDQIWTAAAVHLIGTRPPKLTLFHLLITDTIQHLDGPQSPGAYAALALADAHVSELLRALQEKGLSDQTTLLITSDHGFERPKKLISPNVILRKAGLQRSAPRWRAQAVSEGGTAFVYLTSPATADQDRVKVINVLRGREGIADILEADSFAALHLPHPKTNQQMADLILVAKEDYAFSNDAFDDNPITSLTRDVGSHGYLSTNPRMNGIFIAWGRGIKAGAKVGLVDNIDIASTIAALCDVALPEADGKVLQGILKNPAND